MVLPVSTPFASRWIVTGPPCAPDQTFCTGMSVVHHVLSKFDKDDYIGILQSIDKVDDAVNYYLQEKNFEKTMQKYNG